LFVDGALNSTCEESSNGNKDWYGCQLDVSDSYLSQHNFYYGLLPNKVMKMVMQSIPDPSSDIWYRTWWRFLLASEEVSDPRFRSKGNAQARTEEACKDYLQANPDFGLHLLPGPVSCSVLFVTDSSAYAVVEFPDLVNAIVSNHVETLPETFGRRFASSGYDGAVIFKSPWTTGDSPKRVYHMYPLRSIAFSWEEANSGVRDMISASLDLFRERETGQADRDVFSSAPEVKDELQFRNAMVMKVVPVPEGGSLVDLTDGSEWSVPHESQSRCHFDVGSEASIFSHSGGRPPSVSISVSGKNCSIEAVFVKGW
jgi:hypothetical protein